MLLLPSQDRAWSTSSTDKLKTVQNGLFASCALNRRVHSQPAQVLQWIGAPFRQYLLSDVLAPSFPAAQLKLVIFANALQMRPEILNATRAKLALPLPDGSKRTLLFIWAAGMINGRTGALDDLGPGQLLGMGLTRGPGSLPLVTQLSSSTSATTNASAGGAVALPPPLQFGEQDYPVSPWFYGTTTSVSSSTLLCGPPTAATEILGHFLHSTSNSTGASSPPAPLPSLLRSTGNRCDLVFSGTPGLPASLYGQLATAAGVHRWVTGKGAINVTVEAAGGAVFVHCGQGEVPCTGVQLSLPRVVRAVYVDSLSGPIPVVAACQNCSSLALEPLAAGTVRVFRLED